MMRNLLKARSSKKERGGQPMKSKDVHMPHNTLEHALTDLYSTRPSEGFEQSWRAAIFREERTHMSKPQHSKGWVQRFGKVAIPALAVIVLVVGAQWVGVQENLSGSDTLSLRKTEVSRSSNLAALSSYDSEMDQIVYEDSVPQSEPAMGGLAISTSDAQKKIIRTASMTLATHTFDMHEQAVRQMTEEHGGYVENMRQYTDGSIAQLRRVSYTLRIPTDQLDAFLAGTAGVGRVTSRSESATDQSVQYADTSLRLQTQQNKMERLQELLKRADNVSDLMEIESEIAATQYEIDSYQTTLRQVDRDVDKSEVSITLVEESPAQSAAEENVQLGERLSHGLSASFAGLSRFFQNMLVFIVMALPVLVPLAILSLLILLVRRSRRRKAEPFTPDHIHHKEETEK